MGMTDGVDWLADLDRVLLPESVLRQRVRELAQAIAADYAGKDLLVLGVLTGSFVFVADLVRALDLPLEVGFISASSYGKQSASNGQVTVLEGLWPELSGRDVLLVEDIVDSGHTLAHLRQELARRGPRSVAVCCLLDKTERREVPVTVEYLGFSVPNEFLVGYGLDYAGRFRHLPYVAALKAEAYQGKDEQSSEVLDDVGAE